MNRGDVHLAASLPAADFGRLGEQVAEVEQAGADRLHADVMDGHFVFINAGSDSVLVHWEGNPECDLEVDGGINVTTAPLVVEAGANVLVAGSAIFADVDGGAAAMSRLRAAIGRGVISPAVS